MKEEGGGLELALDKIIEKINSNAVVIGKHIYGNLYNCDKEVLMQTNVLSDIIKKACEIGNMKLLDIKTWRIGLGVSIVAIILESHISLHTWPEYNFATLDVYSCGEHTKPEDAFNFIAKALKAKKIVSNRADRSFYRNEDTSNHNA